MPWPLSPHSLRSHPSSASELSCPHPMPFHTRGWAMELSMLIILFQSLHLVYRIILSVLLKNVWLSHTHTFFPKPSSQSPLLNSNLYSPGNCITSISPNERRLVDFDIVTRISYDPERKAWIRRKKENETGNFRPPLIEHKSNHVQPSAFKPLKETEFL